MNENYFDDYFVLIIDFISKNWFVRSNLSKIKVVNNLVANLLEIWPDLINAKIFTSWFFTSGIYLLN